MHYAYKAPSQVTDELSPDNRRRKRVRFALSACMFQVVACVVVGFVCIVLTVYAPSIMGGLVVKLCWQRTSSSHLVTRHKRPSSQTHRRRCALNSET